MKKLGMLLLCAGLIGTCAGCSSSKPMIKSYTDTALENKRLIIKTTQDDYRDFFAEDLVVFSKKAISVQETEDTLLESTNTEPLESPSDIDLTASTEEDTISSDTVLLAGIDTMEDVYGKNVYDRIYPASITKIMTALITLHTHIQ